MRVVRTARAGGVLTALARRPAGHGLWRRRVEHRVRRASSPTGSAVTTADLDGSTFESTSVEGHDLVPGSTVRLTFENGSLSANAGCNTMSSSYAVTDGRLAWTGHPMSTMMGCPDDLHGPGHLALGPAGAGGRRHPRR